MAVKRSIILIAVIIFFNLPDSIAKTDIELGNDLKKAGTELPSTITADEMRHDIKEELEADEEILKSLPILKKQVDTSGKVFYTYRIGERDVNIDELDVETLDQVLGQIYNQEAILNWNRLKDQQNVMNQTRAAQNIQVQQAPVRPPELPPALPTGTRDN